MKKCNWMTVLLLVVGVVVPAYGDGIIVNHTNWNWYNGQTQEVFNRVGSQSVFFSHASVGSNITSGLSTLHSSNATTYRLIVTGEDGMPPAATQAGRFYEYGRGNPGWQVKMDTFKTYVANGWSSPKVGFSMDKLCYIDENASASYYLNMMNGTNGLINTYPDTQFVLWTMPLTTSTGSDNVLRNNYNNAVRSYAAANSLLLFDIADIEAWSPSGEQQTFLYNGTTYQRLYSGYTGDGGHLNSIGSERVATGIYSLLGQATQPSPVPIPAAIWIFGPAVIGLIGLRTRSRKQ